MGQAPRFEIKAVNGDAMLGSIGNVQGGQQRVEGFSHISML
jgi:hypothetical protein